MDAKDLRTEAALGDRSNDGNTKYVQGGGALPCHRNKTYQDIGSNSLAKVDTAARPCAVIGPDRVVPPVPTDVYYKKGPPEPWLTPENTYRRPPDYPHKLLDYQHPSRNISPRQTFQENMQRIMVPPSYNASKLKEDHNFPGESNILQMRNNKLNVSSDSNSKYCDVPYTVNSMTNDQKNIRNSDISVSNMNTVLARSTPHGWPPTSSNIQPPKPVNQDLCQYPEYQNCAAPRPMVMTRPHRTMHEEPGPVYPDGYYHNGNIRFKPYQVKERYPQTRYEYIGNYSNPFHPPPPFPTHKYDLQKPLPPHPYSSYSQVPLKYLDSRMADPIMNGYQRSLNQQAAYSSIPFRNQVIHPSYGPVPGNCLPTNKYCPYPLDGAKSMPPNKLPYDTNSKLYPDYENNRSKNYPMSDAFYINEIARPLPTKGPVLPPNYPTNIHAMPTHPYYRKEPLKGYEYSQHFRNMDHMLGVNGNIMSRFPSQFSPSAIAISPSDSNTSNDTNLTHGTSQEDCGYVSQSSTASIRSMDSVINRISSDVYRRHDQRYGHIMKGSAPFAKLEQSTSNIGSKEKKEIDVRQFFQMWNEGEDEGGESNNKEVGIKTAPKNSSNNIGAANCAATNQEQLYVLGLVNVPSEELEKYQHIQKVSKLPENIKGYNSIELLHQFEEVIESSNLNHYNDKSPATKVFHNSFKSTIPMHGIGIPSRPLSPLDVEAKISQSVIHKEVGCNFEIKPCSPKMLNVEVATPVQTVNSERMIEKVSNPIINQSPIMHNMNESRDDCNVMKSQGRLSMQDNTKITSCKMVNKPYGNKDSVDPVKTNYSIQDLESNSGVCLASLPRLDNDIELNFPEVNQQFINANKAESVITSGSMKDLPPLDIDQTNHVNREQETDVINSPSKRNLEKDFSKLSKYRKLKRKSTSPNTSESNVQALRTDSVIIKNPENCKYENMEKCLSPKTISREAQNDPINLSVNTESCMNTDTLNFGLNKSVHDRSNDFAIDFSINANESCNFTSNIKVPEIIRTENHNLNRANFVRKEQYKENLSPAHEHNTFNEGSGDGNKKQIGKQDENEKDFNTQSSFCKDSLDLTNILDNSMNSYKNLLQDNPKNKIELNVALKDTSFGQLQKYNVTDKEVLNRKLSTYYLLSSQEKEDTLNEKMRELFGEEFSHVDAEPDFDQIQDTQAILDEDSVEVIKKDVFSDESTQSGNEEVAKKCIPSNVEHCGNEMEETIASEQELPEKRKETVACNNALLAQNTYEKSICENEGDESLKINVNDVVVTDKINTNILPRLDVIDNCINIHHKYYSKADLYRVYKELLSPWIQKLIVNEEGSSTVVTANISENKHHHVNEKIHADAPSEISDTAKDNKNVEMLANYTCTAVAITKNHTNNEKTKNIDYPNVLVASHNFETGKKLENYVELEIGTFNKVLDTVDVNKSCEKLTSDMSVILKDKGNKTDKINENDCDLEIDDFTNTLNMTTRSCEELASDSAKVLDNTNNPETEERLKIHDKQKSDTNTEVLEKAYICVKLENDTTKYNIANDHKIIVMPDNSDKLQSYTYANVLEAANEKKCCEKFPNYIAEVVTANNNKIDEKMRKYDKLEIETYTEEKEKLARDLTKVLKVAIDRKTDKDLENHVKLESETYTKVVETIMDHEINENLENRDKSESDTYTKVLEATTKHKTDGNIENNGKLESDTKSNVLETENIHDSDAKSCEMLEYSTANVLMATNGHETKDNLENVKLDSNTCVEVLVANNKKCSEKEEIEIDPVMKTVDVHEIVESLVNYTSETSKVMETANNVICDIQEHTCGDDLKTAKYNESNDTYNEASEKVNIIRNDKKLKTYKEVLVIDKNNKISENVPDLVSDLEKEMDLKENKQIILSDKQLGENFESNSNHLSNQTLEHKEVIIFSKPTGANIDQDQESRYINMSSITDALEEDANRENIIDDSPIINKENRLQPLKECKHSVEMETIPLHFSSTEEEKNTHIEPIRAGNLIFETHLQDSMTNLQDNTSINEGSNHNVFSPISKANSKLIETYNDHPDEDYCKMPQIYVHKSTNGENISSTGNDMNVHNTNQTEPSLKDMNFSSDSSDETSTSDDENSADSNEFSNYEGTTKDFENQNTVSTEQSQLKFGSTDIQLNNLNLTNPINDELNDTNEKPILKNQIVEGTNIVKNTNAEDELDNLISDPTSISPEDLKTIDDRVAVNVTEDSGFILETSHENTKYEIIEDLTPNEVPLTDSCTKERYSTNYLGKKQKSLKRSLSDSALDDIRDNINEESLEKSSLLWPSKRKKDVEVNNYSTSQFIAENICHVLQNRRNSISAIHNEGNVSFCILIDNNCIISEECDESDKICFSEVPEDCLSCIQEESLNHEDSTAEIISLQEDVTCEYSTPAGHNFFPEEDKLIHEPWVEDVACVETVLSDDIAENIVISASVSPKDDEDDEEGEIYNINEHTEKLKFIYGDKIYSDDAHFVDTLYRTPQMNVNKTLNNRESQNNDNCHTDDGSIYYDKESLERVLSESNVQKESVDSVVFRSITPLPSPAISELSSNANDRVRSDSRDTDRSDTPLFESKELVDHDNTCHNTKCEKYQQCKETKEDSYESSIDDVFDYKKGEESHSCAISSSPEVSSTTSEEKNSGILLKITNYGGSRVSQINDINPIHSISCKYTEKKDYSSSNGNLQTRTLITKAAQKYIPPLKETIRDLKVKLPLPQQSLVKLRQLKLAKETLKPNVDRPANILRKEVTKKFKPKFEDVLKSIDEIQYQKSKEKNKKGRKSIPRVVIKKNEHGSHYASTSSKHQFNPDLTGRKWQPWVFLEKDRFIDKMALRKKTQAIFSHRKNSYVLTEKFRKYKSICNPKFIISQPKQNDSTSGQLKYTIRLKHNY